MIDIVFVFVVCIGVGVSFQCIFGCVCDVGDDG